MSDISDSYYLDHIFDDIDYRIKLDDEQKAAVVGDDYRALVVAGAGSGKTTVIAAKVKYLVERRHVAPEKILVMSYTRKAVEELRRRINIDLNIPAYVTTFHSLGLKYTRFQNSSERKVCPIDNNERNNYFLNFLKEKVFASPEKLDEFVQAFDDKNISWVDSRNFSFGSFFLENYKKFSNFDDYLDSYINKKISETKDITKKVIDIADQKVNGEYPITIRGEITKSKGEAVIANYLYCNNIDYSYERVYEELVGERQTYRPDFSIDLAGEKIYIEYFGLSDNTLDNKTYQRIRQTKEEYHRKRGNKLISLDYLPYRGYLKVLENKLFAYGVTPKKRSIEEIYYILLKQNPLAEFFHLKNLFYSIIDGIKASEKVSSFSDYSELCASYIDSNEKETQFRWIKDFWEYYHAQKEGDSAILRVDYSDMIKMPIGRLHEIFPSKFSFDYVVVDEYQDISAMRFALLNETLVASGANFFAIGDDWQSIYSFQGAKVDYIMDFDKYFPNSKQYLISKTYRNAQSLIDAAGKFVMRNKRQIRKELKSEKQLYDPIVFVKINQSLIHRDGNITTRNDYIEKLIRSIHCTHPNSSICVLARTNAMIKTLFQSSNFIDSAETKVKIKNLNDFYFDAMTIHKSKGLTYDWTIIMPLTSSFPSDPKKEFWALDIVKNEPDNEPIPYAEHRRLLYVALTRTKNRVYILMPQKGLHSRYKDELKTIIDSLKNQQEHRDY